MPTAQEIVQTIGLIEDVAEEYGILDSYFVGGYTRTLAIGLPLSEVHDIDVATGKPGRAEQLAMLVAKAGNAKDVHQHHRTSAITVTLGNVEVDFQGHESHEDVRPYVRLWGVEETPITLNIFDRDFTMNALAIKIGTNTLVDYTKRSLYDISRKMVVSVLPADISVKHDPLMITRGIRMAAKFGFQIDKDLWRAMRKHAKRLSKQLSKERLAIEAYVLSKHPRAREYINALGIGYLETKELIETGEKEAED